MQVLARPDLRRALIILGVALPILLLAVYILRTWQNVPFYDEWDATVMTALNVRTGVLTPQTLVAQHSQQRIFFTRTLTALLTVLNGWDVRIEIVVSFILALIALALAVGLYRDRPTRGLIAVAFALLLFSLRQRHNWITGFQTQYFFPLVFLLGALLLLLRGSVGWRALLGSALLAVSASFAFFSGLLVWPVILLAMPFRGYRDARHYLFWLGAAVLTGLLYFSNYALIEPVSTGISPTIGNYLFYVMAYLGAPFSTINDLGLLIASRLSIVGLLLLAFCALYLWQAAPERRADLGVWLGLAAFAVGSAVLTAVGRVRYMLLDDPYQPLSERYVTHGNLLWLAVIALGMLTIRHISVQGSVRTPMMRWLRIGVIGLFVVLLVLYPVAYLYMLGLPPIIPPGGEACVRAYPETRDASCLVGLYPPPISQITDRIDAMANQRVGPFRP